MPDFDWTERTERAVELVVAGRLTHDAICKEIGIARVTLWVWRKHPEFAARIAERLEEIREHAKSFAIADVNRRIGRLNDTWHKMQDVIAERAAAQEMERVSGGQTGLLVHNVKGVGKGDDFQLIDLYEADTALLRELRETEKQAAIELGQWNEKGDGATATEDPSVSKYEADLSMSSYRQSNE